MNTSLHDIGLLDSALDPSLDNLTTLASNIIGAPVSLLSIIDIDGDRQFFKSQVGLAEPWASEKQTPLSHSFCKHVVHSNAPLVVATAKEHPLLKDNLEIRDLGVMAYLGVPVHLPNGHPIGALCVINENPQQWSHREIGLLENLARCVDDVIALKNQLLANERMRQELRDFSYAISHDLKTPVNTLKMLITELNEECVQLTSDDQEVLDVALRCTERISTQIEAVSRYTRTIPTAQSSESINLRSLWTQIIEDMHSEVTVSGAKINCETLPTIVGDRAQLKMLFENLLSNALKYQIAGQKPIVRIYASTDQYKRIHEIHVKDNGIGIAPEYYDRIFKIFSRLHTQEDYPGTGIGLTLCRRVAANHGGTILVTSVPDTGSTFTVRLVMSSP